MKISQTKTKLKIPAAFVASAFLLQQVAFAAPSLTLFPIVDTKPYSMGFEIPESLASIEDSFDAGKGQPLVYLFQDAHTNESGQINTAHTLELIIQNENIQTVFTEAAQGSNTLSDLKQYVSEHKRNEVGMSYLRKGLLNGVEFLSLTGSKDFEIWGVEDPKLYQQSIEVWSQIAGRRTEILEKLYEIKRGLDLVKREIYDEDLARFDKAVWDFRDQKSGVTDYLEILVEFSKSTQTDLKDYKHLKHLKAIQKQESKIDFQKANLEQVHFISLLPADQKQELVQSYQSEGQHPYKLKNGDQKSSKAFFALLKERLDANPNTSGKNLSNTYPELDKYFKYIEMTHETDVELILDEIHLIEEVIYQKLFKDEDQAKLTAFSSNADYLSRLFEFKLTPQEFASYKRDRRSFHPLVIAGFVNRKIAEFKKNYEQVVIVDPGIDEMILKAEKFYALTYQRDTTFIQQMDQKIQNQKNVKVALVAGGYHAPNLKALLKQKKYSYVSVLPQVLHETDFNRYETLLLSQTKQPETTTRVASKKEDLKTSSRAAMVRLLRSGLFSPRDGWALPGFLKALGLEETVVNEQVLAMVDKLQGGEEGDVSGEGQLGGRPQLETSVLPTGEDDEDILALLEAARGENSNYLRQAVERMPDAAIQLANDDALKNLTEIERGKYLSTVFQLQASRLSPFLMTAVLALASFLPWLTGSDQKAVADQIRVVLDESSKPVAARFDYRKTIEERRAPIERKDLLGFNYQATKGFKAAQDYIDEGRVHEMLAPLLPKNSPILRKYGLESLGRDDANLLSNTLGGKVIRVYYLPIPEGNNTAKDKLIQADYERTNAILNEVYRVYGIRVTLNHWMGLHATPGAPKILKNNAAELEKVYKSVERMAELYGRESWLLLWQLGNEPNYHIKDGKLSHVDKYPFDTQKELFTFHAEAAIRLKAAEAKLGENYRHPVFVGNGSLNELEAQAWADVLADERYDVAVDGLIINAYPGVDWLRGAADLTQIRRELGMIANLLANVVHKPAVIGEIGFWASRDVEEQDKQRDYLDAVRDAIGELPIFGAVQIFAAVDEPWKAISGSPNESRFGITFTENEATRLKSWKGYDKGWYEAEGVDNRFQLLAEIPVGYDLDAQRVTVYGQGPTDTWAGNFSKFEHDLTKLNAESRIFFKIQPNVNKARKLAVKLEGIKNSKPNQFFVVVELIDGKWTAIKSNEGVELKSIVIGKSERGYLLITVPISVTKSHLDRTSVAHVLHGEQSSVSTISPAGKTVNIPLQLNQSNLGNIRGAAVGIEEPLKKEKQKEGKKSGSRLSVIQDPLVEMKRYQPRQAVLVNAPEIYEGVRTNSEIQALLARAKSEGKRVIIRMPLRGVDGSGSANDLPEWQTTLTEQGNYELTSLPSTPTLAAGEVEFEIEALGDDPNAVVYVAPHVRYASGDYKDQRVDEQHPHRVEGLVQLENGVTPKQLDAAAYIFSNLFGITGVKIKVNKISPLASLGGFESSNAVNIALLIFASSLKGYKKGSEWSQADIRAKAIELENTAFEGYTGGQGHNALLEGYAQENIWTSGILDANGNPLYPSETIVRDLTTPETVAELEKRMALVQLGKQFENGIPFEDRHAALIKDMWVSLLDDNDLVALGWYQRQVDLGHEYAEALRSGDFDAAVNTFIEYVKLRDLQTKRWLDLAIRYKKGESNLPSFAEKYAERLEAEPILSIYYNELGDQLADISIYSDFAKEFIEKAETQGIAVFPLGPGGPSSTVAVFAKTPEALQAFLKEQELNRLSDSEIQTVIDGTGTLRGYVPLEIAREGIQFDGFEALGLETPTEPETVLYDQVMGGFVEKIAGFDFRIYDGAGPDAPWTLVTEAIDDRALAQLVKERVTNIAVIHPGSEGKRIYQNKNPSTGSDLQAVGQAFQASGRRVEVIQSFVNHYFTNEAILDVFPDLKLLAFFAAGYQDKIDLNLINERGIQVTNAGAPLVEAMAEAEIAKILDETFHISELITVSDEALANTTSYAEYVSMYKPPFEKNAQVLWGQLLRQVVRLDDMYAFGQSDAFKGAGVAPEHTVLHDQVAGKSLVIYGSDQTAIRLAEIAKEFGVKGITIVAASADDAERIQNELAGLEIVVTNELNQDQSFDLAIHSVDSVSASSANAAHVVDSRKMRLNVSNRDVFKSLKLTGELYGIIGLGAIGRATARRAVALGLKVNGFVSSDPFPSGSGAENESRRTDHANFMRELNDLRDQFAYKYNWADHNIRFYWRDNTSWYQFFSQSQYISIFASANETTKDSINSEALRYTIERVGPNSGKSRLKLLLNSSRGALVDEAALLEFLNSFAGENTKVSLDVLKTEDNRQAIGKHPNVRVTGHTGSAVRYVRNAMALYSVRNTSAFLRGEVLPNLIKEQVTGFRLTANDAGVDLDFIDLDQNPHAHPLIVRTPEGEYRNSDDRSYMGGLFADFLKKWNQIKKGEDPSMLKIGKNFFGTSMLSVDQRQSLQGMTYFADYKDNSEYEQFASENVILTRQILDGGKGLGVAREGLLRSLGLLQIDEKGNPVFGAKATDIKRPIPWRGTVNERGEPTVDGQKVFSGSTRVNADGFLTDASGKEILASIAELKLLQAIEEASEGRYNKLNYIPVVSEDSKPSYQNLLNNGRYLPDVLNGVEEPRPYIGVARQVGLIIADEGDWLVARDVPVFDVATQDLIQDKESGKYTTGGGHGQWGHYNLRDALKSDIPNNDIIRITEIVSGDGLNGSIPISVIGAMAKQKLAVVMAVTQRTDLDAKGGVVGVELIEGESLDDPQAIVATQMEELAQAKAVEDSGVDEELKKFQGIGLDGRNGIVGKEAFNTNVAAINKTVVKGILSDLLDVLKEHYTQQLNDPTLGAQKAEERISEIISPNLIEKLVKKDEEKSHIQLEGAMGLALLSLNRFFEHPNENQDGFNDVQLQGIKKILTSRGLTKVVTPVFFTAEERDEVFTPIKTGFDAWLQMFGGYYELDIIPRSKTRWRYKTIQRDDKALAMPPQLDMDLKDPHYAEIQSWIETLGRRSDTRELTRIKIELANRDAPINIGNAVLSGEVELINESDDIVDPDMLNNILPRALDGRYLLRNVRVRVLDGSESIEARIVIEPIGSRVAFELLGSRLSAIKEELSQTLDAEFARLPERFLAENWTTALPNYSERKTDILRILENPINISWRDLGYGQDLSGLLGDDRYKNWSFYMAMFIQWKHPKLVQQYQEELAAQGARLAGEIYTAPKRLSLTGFLGRGNYFQIQSIIEFLKKKHGVNLTSGDAAEIQSLLRTLPNHELVFNHAIEYVVNYSANPSEVIKRLKLTQQFALQAIDSISQLQPGKRTESETKAVDYPSEPNYTASEITREIETYPFDLNYVDWSEVYRFADHLVSQGSEIRVDAIAREVGIEWIQYSGENTISDPELLASPYKPQSLVLSAAGSRLSDGKELPENLSEAIQAIKSFKESNSESLNDAGRRIFRTQLQERAWEIYNQYQLHQLPVEERIVFLTEVFDKEFFHDEFIVLKRTYNAYKAGDIESDDNGRLTPLGYVHLRNRDSKIVNLLTVEANRNIRVAENMLFDITNRERAILEKEDHIQQTKDELVSGKQGEFTRIVEIQDIHGGSVRLLQLLADAFGLPENVVVSVRTLGQLEEALETAGINPHQLNIRFVGFNDLVDRGSDPQGVFEIIRWLDQTGRLKHFPGNHDEYRAWAVLRLHDYITEAYPKFRADSKRQQGHHLADWTRQAFEHTGWGDIELDQENQRNFNAEVERVNLQIQSLKQKGVLADEVEELSTIDLTHLRAVENPKINKLKKQNDLVRRGQADGLVAELPNIFKDITLKHTRDALKDRNARIKKINASIPEENKEDRIPPMDVEPVDFDNFHRNQNIAEQALWQLKNLKRLYYVSEYGSLHLHNTLPMDERGFAVDFGSLEGFATLDKFSDAISDFFQDLTIDEFMRALENPEGDFAKIIWERLGKIFKEIALWYSDRVKDAKEDAYKEYAEQGGVIGMGIDDQFRRSNALGRLPSFLTTLGHVPEEKVDAPLIQIDPVLKSGTAFVDGNLSELYGNLGIYLSILARESDGNLTGLRIYGFDSPDAQTVSDLTLRDIDKLDSFERHLLRRLHSGEGFLKWLRFKETQENIKDLTYLIKKFQSEERFDRIPDLEQHLKNSQQSLIDWVDQVVDSSEHLNSETKIYDLLILGGLYATQRAQELIDDDLIAGELVSENRLTEVQSDITRVQKYAEGNEVPFAARLASEVASADTFDQAVDLIVSIVDSNADFSVTREQIYTELVVRALDGRPSVTQGVLPVLWEDNSLTAYSFRLDGQDVVIDIPGNPLTIRNFKAESRKLNDVERSTVSAVADEAITLAHEQSTTLSEYNQLLKSSVHLLADVEVPLAVFSKIKKPEHADIHTKLLIKNLEWIQAQEWGSNYVFYFNPEELELVPAKTRQVIETAASRGKGVFVIGQRPENVNRLLFKLFASQVKEDQQEFAHSRRTDKSGVNVNIPVIQGGMILNWTRYIAEAALFVNEVTATGTTQELARAQAGGTNLSIYMERLNQGLEEPIQSEIDLFKYMRGQKEVSGRAFLMKPLRVIAIDALIRGLRMAIATIGASA